MDTAQANALQAILKHDDSSTDAELIEYFIEELEISPLEARKAVLSRTIMSEKNKFFGSHKSTQQLLGESCIQSNFSFS